MSARTRVIATLLATLSVGCGEDDAGTGGASSQASSGTGGATSGEGGASSSSGAAGGDAGGTGGATQAGWTTLQPLPGGPRQETAVVAVGAAIYVLGGFDAAANVVDVVEVYDTATQTWTSGPPLPEPMHHANAAEVDGKLWIVGQCKALTFMESPDVWVLDPPTGRWQSGTSMPIGTARCASAVGVVGSKIVVAGGLRGGAVADASAYDTATDTWEELPPLPGPSDHLVGGVVDGVFYAIGGRASGITGILPDVWALELPGATWIARAPMLTPRGGSAAAAVGSRIFSVGGEGNTLAPTGVFEQNEAYDATADAWVAHEPMPTPRHGTGAAAVGGTVYVPGGADMQAFGAVDTFEAYTP